MHNHLTKCINYILVDCWQKGYLFVTNNKITIKLVGNSFYTMFLIVPRLKNSSYM